MIDCWVAERGMRGDREVGESMQWKEWEAIIVRHMLSI